MKILKKKHKWVSFSGRLLLTSPLTFTLIEIFPLLFASVVRQNARVKFAKTGHGPHSSKLLVICVVLLLSVLFYVLSVSKRVL